MLPSDATVHYRRVNNQRREAGRTLVLLWRRGSNVLTASQLMVTRDERIRLVNGYNLEISELEPQDAGDYVCQISDKVNKDQVHTVEILGKL
uniref:I-set domain-containing protein n=1 Tax=Anopheles epiroticus TaxID=199890 RepID=A0A182PW15_9DIPT